MTLGFAAIGTAIAGPLGTVAGAALGYTAAKVIRLGMGLHRLWRRFGRRSPKDAPQLVYRGGSATPNNLTPRPGRDLDGLSTFDNLEAAVGPGGKAQVIDTTKLNTLCASCSPPPAGHVSISAGNAAANAQWAATRGTGAVHPATQEIIDAVVDTVGRQK